MHTSARQPVSRCDLELASQHTVHTRLALEERDKWGEDMPATARNDSASRKGGTTTGKRGSLVALVCAALTATGSHAFAVKIPIEASLSGGGEAPPNDSRAKGLMVGTFDTDANTLE